MTVVVESGPAIGSPLWFVERLYQVLMARRPLINTYDDYYIGDFPLPWLAGEAQDEFRRILRMSRANYTGLVIDAQCERMSVDGFRINPEKTGGALKIDTKTDEAGQADQEMQRIWQANNLDTYFDQGLLEAAITGMSYLMVEPNPAEPQTPYIHVEHSSQMAVAFRSGTNRREVLAALKVYQDEWTGRVHATLHMPGYVAKYQSQDSNLSLIPTDSKTGNDIPLWSLRHLQREPNPGRTGLTIVPVFELPNNPRLLSGGQSEIGDLMDIQDRIVKTIADRLITQDYGAFPQKWATGWPLQDEQGNATAPIRVGLQRLLSTDVMETKFGQFAAADATQYIEAVRQDIKDMASRSRTPAQYLLGEMNNVNGDTLKASESGLVAKVRQRQRGHNDPLENCVRLVRNIAGLGDGREDVEVIWRNPEFRTEGELVDALVKMQTLGVPEEALWERWGATPTEVVRWKAMLEDKMARAAAGDMTVMLAETFRSQAQPALEGASGGGSGGSSSGAASQRPKAPKPSTT